MLGRVLEAPRAALYRCWTEGALLRRWSAPRPFTVIESHLDVRPGGTNLVVMSDEGTEVRGQGVHLEVVPNERLVVTDT